jgi:hypothetical protein
MVLSSTPSSDVSDTIAPTATMQSDKRWDDYPPRDKLSQGVQSAWDLPGSWGTPSVRSPCSVNAGRTARTRPLRYSSAAPGIRKAKAPTKGLSTLNSMAFGLAVYASQCGLPTPHARLASSRWSDSTGRAFHPQGPDERFQGVYDITSSSPKLAWRNRIDRRSQGCRCSRCSDRRNCRRADPPRTAYRSTTVQGDRVRVGDSGLYAGQPQRCTRSRHSGDYQT